MTSYILLIHFQRKRDKNLKHSKIDEIAGSYKFSKDIVEGINNIYGKRTERILIALKKPNSKYFIRVNSLKSDSEEVIRNLMQKGIEVYRHDMIEEAIFLPTKGPFELPKTEMKITADKYAAESVIQGANLYAPGVINCHGLRKNQRVTVVDEFGEAVGVGIAQMSENEVLALRRGIAVEVTDSVYYIPTLRESREFELGYIYPQSLPAMITSRILDPRPGEEIIDICAAPGGKTSHLAQLMENNGQIVAVDKNKTKVHKLLNTLIRLGIKNTQVICHDARYLDIDFPTLKANKVLVDPPCSSLGVRPKLFDYTSTEEINSLAEYQKQILKTASKIVKLGGIVVYSTCTLTIEENEEVIKYAIENCNLELIEEKKFCFGSPGIQRAFNKATLAQRFEPDVHEDCQGYFIAKMERKR